LTRIDAVPEDPEIIAGRQAEQFLLQLVETNLKYRGAYCFLAKRIPSKIYKRRFEIDLMVLTKKHLHFLEVKNWSGEVIASESNWIQIRRNGEQIDHPNLVEYNSTKQQVVIEFLRENGIDLDRSYFSQKVIFMNCALDLDPIIANNPNVVPPDRLDDYLATQKGSSFAERIIHSIIEICLDLEKSETIVEGLFRAMPSRLFKKIKKLFCNLGTWDKVGLYGDKVLTGDVLKFYIGEKIIDTTQFQSEDHIRISWTRNKIVGLMKSLATNLPIGILRLQDNKIPVQTNDTIKFHPAGEKRPIQFALSHVDWIIKG
jgi:hypothetical protein